MASRFRVFDSGFRVSGLRAQGLGFGAWGLRVSGPSSLVHFHLILVPEDPDGNVHPPCPGEG